MQKLKEFNESSNFEKPKSSKSRVLVTTHEDDDSEEEDEPKQKQEKKSSKKEKAYEYNKVTGVYHSPNLDEYEIQMITDLSGLAKSLKLIKNEFREKSKKSVFVHDEDHDKKDTIVSELKHLHDFDKRDKTSDLEDIDDVFKIKTLDSCLNFFNDILLSQFQLFLKIPTFQDLIKEAVDLANDREEEGDEEEEYKSIEKLSPNQVTEYRPVEIVPKFIGSEEPSSRKGPHFV